MFVNSDNNANVFLFVRIAGKDMELTNFLPTRLYERKIHYDNSFSNVPYPKKDYLCDFYAG